MANKIAQVRFSDLNSASTRPGRQGGQGVDRTRAHAKQKPRSDGAIASGNSTALAVNVVLQFVDNEFLL